ncbi:MAG TPA: hypothetical protein VNA69_04380 [Thermoanaerobaculia bacterium]|nr:hypothetical protein [Thermoanaerobaculia bacterium]
MDDEILEALKDIREEAKLTNRRLASLELRFATEVLAGVTRDLRELISRKLDDHHMVLQHEKRITTLENRIADR